MMDCEEEAIQQGRLAESQRLPTAMRRSWESGEFWIMYDAKNNIAFDAIYWQKIDERFFGSTKSGDGEYCDNWKQRPHLLELEEQEFMEKRVDLKLNEMEA